MDVSVHVQQMTSSATRRLCGLADYEFNQLKSAYALHRSIGELGLFRPSNAGAIYALAAATRANIEPSLILPFSMAFGIACELELASDPTVWAWGSAKPGADSFFTELYAAQGSDREELVARDLGHSSKRKIFAVGYYPNAGIQGFSKMDVHRSLTYSSPSMWVDADDCASRIRAALEGPLFTVYPKELTGTVN